VFRLARLRFGEALAGAEARTHPDAAAAGYEQSVLDWVCASLDASASDIRTVVVSAEDPPALVATSHLGMVWCG
jgi:hypothetical protein